MQQREKKIVWGIAGLIGLYIGYGIFHSWFIKPLNDLDIEIETAQRAVDSANAGKRNLKLAEIALADAQRISLPKNVSEARRLYLRFIEDLTISCGIQTSKNPESTSERIEAGGFIAYPVKVDGVATYEQAMLFLKRFSEVNLLQRISQFDLVITTPGDPRLFIRFTAEGLSVNGASDRSTIFPETLLVDALPPAQTVLTVADVKGFPEKAPFRIKVGPEWMDVTALNKNQWTVTRGVEESKAAEHPKGQQVSLFPLKPAVATDSSIDQTYSRLIASNHFRKPRPAIEFKPRLTPSGGLLVTKGSPWSVNLKAESWDPEAGAPKFSAEGELPAGLTLDEATGALKWSPDKDFAPGEYKVKIAAVGSYNANFKTSAELPIKVRDANRSPRLPDARPARAYLGRPWTADLAATDPDMNDQLKYSLGGTPPMGAAIDSRGKVTWTPPEDLEPGEVGIIVNATDNGDPPLTATRTYNVRVEEDAARFTKFVGVVTEAGVPEAW
ncbi:MAG TPA: putative Ig domain-containing protein, partial [Caulifigura sp.]|nr:putative Ig domain-containing protein [Caulifigura sp.]